LRCCFCFSQFTRADGKSLHRRNTPQAGNGEFPPDQKDYQPSWNDLYLNERNKRRRDEEFISDWIEQRADGCNLFPTAREISVEKIGSRRKPENQQRNQIVVDYCSVPVKYDSLLDENGHKQWDEEYSGDGEAVGEVHASRPSVEITQL